MKTDGTFYDKNQVEADLQLTQENQQENNSDNEQK
jgi:hypothetical protein